MTDESYMQIALGLALRGTGLVSPNPRVGALIVKDGEIIGQGWHKKFGGPHAEIEAINSASGHNLAGSTIYVTLEPCSHYGKTPPCAEALVKHKFGRVVIGMTDPNPLVNGRGVKILTDAGIEVATGVLEEECRWVNRFFIKNITTSLPYVILKSAASINGAIATETGKSKWITGSESLRRSHELRAEVDAVLVGRNTALLDNPSLTVRNVEGRNPKRVILDTHLSLPPELNVFTDEFRYLTIVCCSDEASRIKKADNLRAEGVNVLPVGEVVPGNILSFEERADILNNMLKKLALEFSITSILVEGGAEVMTSFAMSGLADEYHFFIAPLIIPGGKNSFGGFSIDSLSQAKRLSIKSVTQSGDDLHVIALNKGEISSK